MKKRFFLAAMTLLVSMGAFAQGNGIGGISLRSRDSSELEPFQQGVLAKHAVFRQL